MLALEDISPQTKLLALSLGFVIIYITSCLNLRALLIILILISVIILTGMLLDNSQNEGTTYEESEESCVEEVIEGNKMPTNV